MGRGYTFKQKLGNLGRKVGSIGKKILHGARKGIDLAKNVGNAILPALAAATLVIPGVGEIAAPIIAGGQAGINLISKGLDLSDDLINNRVPLDQAVMRGTTLIGDGVNAYNEAKGSKDQLMGGVKNTQAQIKQLARNPGMMIQR